MEEKRKNVRFRAPFYVKYSFGDQPNESPALAKDINMCGIRLLLEKPLDLPLNEKLTLRLLLPDKTFQTVGKVMWKKEYSDRTEAGVSLNVLDSCKEDIFNYVFRYYPHELTRRWWQT